MANGFQLTFCAQKLWKAEIWTECSHDLFSILYGFQFLKAGLQGARTPKCGNIHYS